jgi:putative ABC transport system permease protein
MTMLEAVWQDVRYAARSLRRAPGFTAAAVVTLAFGIGATTAVFSVVSATLLRPLPYHDPDRLIVLWQEYTSRGWGVVPVSHPNFASVTRQATTLDGLAGIQFESVALTGVAEPEMLVGVSVTSGAFQLLGVNAAIGRTLTEADLRPGAERVVVLSDGLWKRRFGADSTLIGQAISVDGERATVVGVMPRSFAFPPRFRASVGGNPLTTPAADLWKPLVLDTNAGMVGTRSLFVIGRLAPDATLATAREEAAAIAPRLLEEFPGPANTGLTLALRPFHEQIAGDVRQPLLLLLGAVGLVVLIACANVASMLMARGMAKHAELALRAALGASRARLIRQALVESLLLAFVSGMIGLLLASWVTTALSTTIASRIPHLQEIALDGPVLAFTALLAMIVGLVFGIAPAVHASAIGLRERFSRTTSGQSAMPVRKSYGRALLTCEAALTLLLLVVAGLFARSFYTLVSVDPGFDPSRALAIGFELPSARYQTHDQRRLFYEQLVSRLGALPGVEAVGITSRIPLSGGSGTGGLNIEGRPAPSPDQRPHAAQRIVDAGYFRTMDIRMVRGRGFEAGDRAGAAGVAVINETAARRFWPGEDPIGQRVLPDGVREWLTIVGIVEDVRHAALSVAAQPEVYWPFVQRPLLPSPDASSLPVGVVLRSEVPAANLAAAVRREVSAIDSGLPSTIVTTFDDLVSESVAESRLYTATLGLFAVFGLIVAASGLYGVLSFVAAQRRQEMGIRLALGAEQRRVLFMMLREGVTPVLAGLLIGLGVAFGARGLIADQLYEVSASDTFTLTAVPLLLLAVALMACYIPAQRAARVAPAVTLRSE